jgi:undecaprenyl diphosphate synthase
MIIPEHVAIIMDGNGRWANLRGRPRIFGHIRGSSQVRPIVRECGKQGIKYLTLFCFSSENWGRPVDEVSLLMKILKKYLIREIKTLMENNVQLRAIGDLHYLPLTVRETLEKTIQLTSKNTGLILTFALSYGARQEILQAVRQIAVDIKSGELDIESLNESLFCQRLFTAGMPDPDLVIRTSGEHRLSNFMLWQSAYSEFYISKKYWPEFDIEELKAALRDFALRSRRFGLTSEQVLQKNSEPEFTEAL